MGSAVNGVADGILKAAALTGVAGVLHPLAVQYGHCADGWLEAGRAVGAELVAMGVGFLASLVLAEAAYAAFFRDGGVLRKLVLSALVLVGVIAIHSVASVLVESPLLKSVDAECVDSSQTIVGSD